jgi:hypothetical protein
MEVRHFQSSKKCSNTETEFMLLAAQLAVHVPKYCANADWKPGSTFIFLYTGWRVKGQVMGLRVIMKSEGQKMPR